MQAAIGKTFNSTPDDLRELLKDLIIHFLPKGIQDGDTMHCPCPTHKDKHPSAFYSAKNKAVSCNACGKFYDVFTLASYRYGYDNFVKIRDKLINDYVENGGAELFEPIPIQQGDMYYKYLINRSIKPEMIDRFGICAEFDKKFKTKLVSVPCDGNFRARRSINRNTFGKHWNLKGAKVDLFNSRVIENPNGGLLFVVEGVYDALTLLQRKCRLRWVQWYVV